MVAESALHPATGMRNREPTADLTIKTQFNVTTKLIRFPLGSTTSMVFSRLDWIKPRISCHNMPLEFKRVCRIRILGQEG